MFKKILIANRGEIACRIIRTARGLGIGTIALYSDADEGAPHCRLADEAVRLGKAPSSESYLNAKKILAVAKQVRADAVHPGYGFLSENADFAKALEEAGIVFVGPPPKAIAMMGDKITSKELAAKAGVATIPGAGGTLDDSASMRAAARELGFPVMLKASAGGGGKGMRIVHREAELEESLVAAKREALSSFGDDRVFMEKFITRPRHIEIQILGDRFGGYVHFGERECSLQRRNQKVLEEAPSSFVAPRVRAAMGKQALALAKAVGYHSAGTVEFVMDEQQRFYFLEMNTRLQVEHPVTEMVYGVDLVEEMLRIAAGKKLRHKQAQLQPKGAAIEVRLYAEDPYRNFLPSTGRLVRYRPPPLGERLRLDDGVDEGSEVAIFYDPMLAKLIAHGRTRKDAAARLQSALDEFQIEGIRHNLDFLSALLQHKRFLRGDTTTDFIATAWPDGFVGVEPTPQRVRQLAAAAFLMWHRTQERTQDGARAPTDKRKIAIGKTVFTASEHASGVLLEARKERHIVRLTSDWQRGDPQFEGWFGKARVVLTVRPLPEGYALRGEGASIAVAVRSARAQKAMAFMRRDVATASASQVRCPMPGVVLEVAVSEGQEVKSGEALFIVEAMKMENVIRAEREGKIAAIHCAQGDKLAVDALMLEFA